MNEGCRIFWSFFVNVTNLWSCKELFSSIFSYVMFETMNALRVINDRLQALRKYWGEQQVIEVLRFTVHARPFFFECEKFLMMQIRFKKGIIYKRSLFVSAWKSMTQFRRRRASWAASGSSSLPIPVDPWKNISQCNRWEPYPEMALTIFAKYFRNCTTKICAHMDTRLRKEETAIWESFQGFSISFYSEAPGAPISWRTHRSQIFVVEMLKPFVGGDPIAALFSLN